jgi:hypothetical protein
MRANERPRHRGPARRGVFAMVTVIFASLLWIAVVSCTPAQGAQPSTAALVPRLGASAPPHTPDSGHSRKHKEGSAAVVASVLAVVVVVVVMVGLGSLSARRRTRNGPPLSGQAPWGPPERWRGFFR